jgi:hypothetical protein
MLKAQVNEADVKRNVQRSLRIVSNNSGKLLPNLDVERPNDPIQLDLTNLTIKVTGEHRDDYLWEIGSGSNWLSYHLALMLGLQQFFLAQAHNVVPSLLIFDQPSQVYFPKLLVQREGENQPEPKFERDEDIIAVRKAFSVLGKVVAEANGKLQVIVLDHAPDTVWGGLPHLHLVEEWRNGIYLVPKEWLV